MRYARWIALAVAIALLVGGGAIYATRDQDAVATAGLESAGAPQPYVDGNRLLDARTGGPFVPRGVNWSSFEYACAQGWGMSSLDTMGGQDQYDHEARAIASWGVNTVRLPLNQDCWLGTRGAPVSDQFEERTPEDYRGDVAAFVGALNRQGIVVVLDLHSRKRAMEPEFGNVAMPDSQSLTFWRSVAGQYAGNRSVMFDAFSEPYSRYNAVDKLVFDLTWKCWRDGGCQAPVEDDATATSGRTTYTVQGMAAVVRQIRDAGAEQPILLGGLDYANDLSHWLDFAPDDDQLVASVHAYDFKTCLQSCWDSVLAPLTDRVPVITGELGAEDPTSDSGKAFLRDYLSWADDHGVGSLFWVWADHPNDPMALVRSEDGTPTAYGALVRRYLRGASTPPDPS
ncbi:glycoside hydrolase family 5 protein [Nocardioides mangrovi]|uniref:Glycoside hydrolase family 5 protein n=1 Tax=Nocardioides mangrovi TaxID=2874580 RepID=A0ABS7UHS5_9ACTN|nr:cellulase family glycosylhydrolase [Nocardioides mangrovi]MBZ5740551.1 glycoside hydrolase family 5 protein [Nocardioides mangrovi]